MPENIKHPKWTPSQKRAIDENGCELLVAAGAGSGKTSVLTQRIMEKIKKGSDLDGFLVVTFTSASAEDMKEKLRKKISEEIRLSPENKHLSNQLAKLPFANICTMSSYCLKIVKQNFTILDLSPSVRIADESEAAEIFQNAFDELLDEKFSQKDNSLFTVLNESACLGKENKLFEYLTTIYKKLRAHPRYREKLLNLSDIFSQSAASCKEGKSPWDTEPGKLISSAVITLCNDAEEDAKELLYMGEEFGGELLIRSEKFYSFFKRGKDFAVAKEFLKSAEEFNNAKSYYTNGWRGSTVFSGVDEEEKKAYNVLRESARDKAVKAADFLSEAALKSEGDIIKCAKITEGIKDLILRLDEIYLALKKEKGVLDFTDAEQFAFQLLFNENNEKSQICMDIAAHTDEVLVDEYQDTNPLQDSIFAALADKNNRFMVGDDKQSIYRFRNAYPDIFNGYKSSFNTERAKCIFLRENFRCSKEIIDFTNDIFGFLWGETYRAEQLIFAKNESRETPVTVKTFISKLKTKEAHVLESRYIGTEILHLMESYVKEDGSHLTYSDIAILLPVTKNVGEIFASELRKMNIPVASGKPGLLTDTPEIKLIVSILRSINNPFEDFSLASAMNSFFFDFSADELVKIRNNRSCSLYESVVKYTESRRYFGSMKLKQKSAAKKKKKNIHFIRREKKPLKEKCSAFLKRLSTLRIKSREMECRKFVWYLYETEKLLYNIQSLPDKEIKKGNLLLLYSEAISFGKREHKSLSSFLKHIENLQTAAYSPDGANAVSIMTIHSSKGLEFPVCFLANAGRSLNLSAGGEKEPIVNIDRGIFIPVRDGDLYTRYPVLFTSQEISEKSSELAENKRKLYVALTRAKEKLYIVGTSSSEKALSRPSPKLSSSYLCWIHSSHPQGDYSVEFVSSLEEIQEASKPEPLKQSIFFEEKTFTYPYEKVPGKLSVSQLESISSKEYKQTVKKKDFLSVPRFASASQKVSAAEIGTANHTFMQFASFENCISLGVEYEGERLLLTNMITDEQYGMLNFKNLKGFFQSSLWKRIKNSPKIFREKRFTISHNSKDLLGTGNDEILVQGVIDLFFENPDGTYTVVDYKTDKAKEGDENILSERYKGQLSYYAKAVREMTGKDVTDVIIYSFSIGKEIKVKL